MFYALHWWTFAELERGLRGMLASDTSDAEDSGRPRAVAV